MSDLVHNNANQISINEKNSNRYYFFSKWCSNGPGFWCRKYFWEGQLHKESISGNKSSKPMTPHQRKLMAIAIPALIMHFGWWAVTIQKNLWYIFPEKYFMSITMVFGSLIAGMTSEGGGAVAFPVMTLAFGVKPSIARDFSVMIQSFGMTAAMFTLFFMKIHLEMSALIFCSIGGAGGVIFGLEVLDPRLTPPQKKMGFVSIWFSFAFALFLLNWNHKRPTFNQIQRMDFKKVVVLVLTGFVGGCFTSFAGSGLDICCFSVLTLLFRLSEKVATPTSVCLMAVNTVVCFFWRGLIINAIETEAWEYVMACIPIVVLGAPIGSLLGSHFHRLVLAALIYMIDTVALVSAFIIVPQTPALAGTSVAIIVVGFGVFFALTYLGQRLFLPLEKNVLNISDAADDSSGKPGDILIANGKTKCMTMDKERQLKNGKCLKASVVNENRSYSKPTPPSLARDGVFDNNSFVRSECYASLNESAQVGVTDETKTTSACEQNGNINSALEQDKVKTKF